ncbi:MAG: extracellular solute-binding protein [Streptosporangiales bacterium]|nr:extracellular solute-binding protein [Streptosporangiales bacterium]
MSGRLTRRTFLATTGIAAVGTAVAGCGGGGEQSQAQKPSGPAPKETFSEPRRKLSGNLRLLMWSHFIPAHDEWFDSFAKKWGEQVGVNVTVDHVNVEDIPARISSEISAGRGHDLLQYTAPLGQFEPSVLDLTDLVKEANNRFGDQLELCQKSSFNPNTNGYYAYAPFWAPDPGDYRKSIWRQVGLPNGPTTWDELLRGGTEIKKSQGIQMGLGMSQEVDSNMAARALLWSYGASIQDENEKVTINSDATIATVEYMVKLFKGAMTNEVFSWNPASNNQGLIAGQFSYILNSISAFRTAQEANPEVADDIFFVPALEGPEGGLAAQHVMYNWIVPKGAANPDAAQEFLLHYTANAPAVAYHSQLYDFPGWPDLVPQLDGWLAKDPFGSKPANKLAFLKDAVDWSVNIGYPGPANPAIGEIFGTYVIPNMYARAARGERNPQQAVAEADREINGIFEKWRGEGLVGG